MRKEIKDTKPKKKFQKLASEFGKTLKSKETKEKVNKGLKKIDNFLDKFGFD